MTKDCIDDVINTYGIEKEIIVVDDGSYTKLKPGSIGGFVKRIFSDVKVFRNEENMGFAYSVNRGIQEASHDLICLLNNDIRLPNNKWLKLMVDEMEKEGLDMTAPAGGRMDGKWNYIPGEAKKKGEKFSYLVGWCLLVKKKVFDKIGLMPTDFGKGLFEDVLFGHRARRAGFKMDITEDTGVQHLYHATFKKEGFNISNEYQEKRKIFLDIIKNEK